MTPPDLPVPTSADDLTSPLLGAALGRTVGVTSVERVGAEFGFAGESYRVEMESDGGPVTVVAKLWAMRDAADAAEIDFYGRMAGTTPVRLPKFHHGGADPDAARAWIVLEALEGFRQGDGLAPEPLPSVLAIVDVVAGVHAAWWAKLADQSWLAGVPRVTRDHDYLTSRRAEYLARFGPLADPLTSALFDAIPEAVPLAERLLADAPATLLHSDIGLDNILFLHPGDRPVLIDWARCGRGPGVHDLAAVLINLAPLDSYDEVFAGYMDGLAGRGVAVDAAAMTSWLGGGMIQGFVTQTLGVARWQANTRRGLDELELLLEETPQRAAAWRAMDPGLIDRILG